MTKKLKIFSNKKALMEAKGIGRKKFDTYLAFGFIKVVVTQRGDKVGFYITG